MKYRVCLYVVDMMKINCFCLWYSELIVVKLGGLNEKNIEIDFN